MEESWINLNVQQKRTQQLASHEDESEEVTSAPSTDTSTSSSLNSLQSPDERISRSGSTDENLRASLNTLLDKNQQGKRSAAEDKTVVEKQRRDTITPADRPKAKAQEKEGRPKPSPPKEERAPKCRSAYWNGFLTGITLGFSTALCGIVFWRLTLRFRVFAE